MLALSLIISLGVFFTQDLIFANYVWFGAITLYLLAYGANVFHSSSRGEEHPPDWPEMNDPFRTVILPVSCFIIATLAAFGPALLLYTYLPSAWRLIAVPIALIGAYFWPMLMVATSLWRSLMVINPRFIIKSIRDTQSAYIKTASTTISLLALILYLERLLIELNLLSFLGIYLVIFYLLMVQMRLLGVFYHAQREELRWFNES